MSVEVTVPEWRLRVVRCAIRVAGALRSRVLATIIIDFGPWFIMRGARFGAPRRPPQP